MTGYVRTGRSLEIVGRKIARAYHYWRNEMTWMKCTNCGYVQNYGGRPNLTYTCPNRKRSDTAQQHAAPRPVPTPPAPSPVPVLSASSPVPVLSASSPVPVLSASSPVLSASYPVLL